MGLSNIAFSDMVLLAETQSPVTVFFAQHGIQVVLAVMTIYYAVKLLVFKDVDSVRPKEWKKLKEENVEHYAREAGILALGFAFVTDFSADALYVPGSTPERILFTVSVTSTL